MAEEKPNSFFLFAGVMCPFCCFHNYEVVFYGKPSLRVPVQQDRQNIDITCSGSNRDGRLVFLCPSMDISAVFQEHQSYVGCSAFCRDMEWA